MRKETRKEIRKKIIYCISILFTALFLSSCGKTDLTRDKAHEMLSKKSFYDVQSYPPIEPRYSLYYDQKAGKIESTGREEFLSYMKMLQGAGLITITEKKGTPSWKDGPIPLTWHIALTDKAKDYVVKVGNFGMFNFIKGRGVIDKVTGITNEPSDINSRIVEVTTKIITTPIAEVLPLSEKEKASRTMKVMFKKYDDGWRISGTLPGL